MRVIDLCANEVNEYDMFSICEQTNNKGYWINELESLGISPKEIERDYESESDCIKELADHVENIKQALYTKNTRLPLAKG